MAGDEDFGCYMTQKFVHEVTITFARPDYINTFRVTVEIQILARL